MCLTQDVSKSTFGHPWKIQFFSYVKFVVVLNLNESFSIVLSNYKKGVASNTLRDFIYNIPLVRNSFKKARLSLIPPCHISHNVKIQGDVLSAGEHSERVLGKESSYRIRGQYSSECLLKHFTSQQGNHSRISWPGPAPPV